MTTLSPVQATELIEELTKVLRSKGRLQVGHVMSAKKLARTHRDKMPADLLEAIGQSGFLDGDEAYDG
jgi:hypothetical protein